MYAEINVALLVNAQQLPIVNGEEVFCPLRITVNGSNLAIVKGVVTTLHLRHDLTLEGYGRTLNKRGFNYLGSDGGEPRFGELVRVAT